jgi:hypothetical protein
MIRTFVWPILGAVLGMAVADPAFAHVPLRAQGTRPPVVNVIDTGKKLDANQLSMFVTNIGSFAYDLGAQNSGLEFPKGTLKTCVYAAGLWMGAKVGNEVRVTVAEYSQEFVPGPMVGGGPAPDQPTYRVYKVSREDTTGWADWVANAAPLGAPVDTVSGLVVPHIIGDQTMWAVFNDADPNRHTNDAGNSAPLGVEIQLTAFAFNRQGALGNTAFLSYKIINKGANTLDSAYVSIWSDPDNGGAGDDLVGVDTTLSLGYCYNATNNDNVYGNRPPAVGFDFFQGPTVNGEILPLRSFNKYVNGTDPNATQQSYNYMKGLNADGTPVIDPTTNQVTPYTNPGDPVAGTGWLDTNPADRRLMLSTGPFTMVPGDTQTVVTAVIVGQGRDRLSSVKALKFYDQSAQDAFDRNFNLPNPPDKPLVEGQGLDRKVVLTWDSGSQVDDSASSYKFEGYNIYQGATVAGPWTRIATYDIVNGIATISDAVFDLNLGDIVVAPVQFGEDSGVRHSIEITTDAIRGGGLHNGTAYYYSVTAYSYDPAGSPRTLENAQGTAGQDLNAVIVYPQGPVAGTDLGAAAVDSVVAKRFDENIPATTDVVTAEVVDPTKLTGCDYEVFYTDATPPFPTYGGTEVTRYWNLRRICADGADAGTAPDTTVVLANQLNKTGDTDYQVVDGLLVRVTGAYAPQLQDVVYVKTDVENPRDLQPVDFGLAFYGGAADYAVNFFDSTINPTDNPEQFTTVEVRFDSTATQKAYRYFRDGVGPDFTTPTSDGTRGYYYGGFVDVNFQVWDVVNNRQLDAAFVEKRYTDDNHVPTGEIYPTNDGTWRPSTAADGDREYLFISGTTYTDTPKPEYQVNDAIAGTGDNPASLPLMYAFAAHALDDENPYPDNGEMVRFIWANPGSTNDVFVIHNSAAVTNDPALAQAALERVRVVPNPYYTRSNYEQNQFSRQIRFTNLPATCTIRIFNLAGDLVRTLQKTDTSTSLFTWDVLTENQLPVGSGVYIYQIDAPGVGQTHGRMIVFMEKERLNNF